jgi:hypothetical protein
VRSVRFGAIFQITRVNVRGETHTSWHRMHTATGREEELETEPTARDGTLQFGRTSHGEATDG